MNKLIKILLIIVIIQIVTSCKNEPKYPDTLNDALKGLTEAASADMIRLSPIKWDQHTAPDFYLFDGTKLSQAEQTKQMQSQKYKNVYYYDTQENIKAVVLVPLGENDVTLANDPKNVPKLAGNQVPAFQVEDIYGNLFSSKDLKGKVIVLNFWFINCPPCVKEIPELNKLVATYKNKEVVFISMGKDSKYKIEKFLKNTPFDYHPVAVTRELLFTFGIKKYPTSLIIDKTGTVVYQQVGYGGHVYEAMQTEIEKLL